MNFYFITAVWGHDYTSLFLDICLPNQITPGNLLCFAKYPDTEYAVYTTRQDAERIEANHYFKKIKDVVKTRIVMIDHLFTSNDQVMTEYNEVLMSLAKCHSKAVEDAAKKNAVMVFLAPDAVWSEGAFARMREIAESGKRVVALPGARVNMDTFIPAMLKDHQMADGSIQVSSRELVKLAMNNPHPLTEALYVDSNSFTEEMAFHLYWNIEGKGMLARCLLLHPMMVYPRVKNHSPLQSFDGAYLLSGCPDFDDYHIVTDSDEIVVFELSPPGKFAETLSPCKFSPARYCSFVAKSSNTMLKFLENSIHLHSEEINSAWNQAENESERLIERALYTSALHDKYGFDAMRRQDMDNVRTVAIVGTCKSKGVKDLVKECGWEISYVVPEGDESAEVWFSEYPQKSFNDLSPKDVDLIIVGSSANKKSIIFKLESFGYTYSKDFIYYLDPVRVGNFEMRVRPLQDSPYDD